ncbi:unnamed protein product [Lymnaea stagnalis]|uniref:Cytochrome P450 n=1 Tax=Lymnaea stagnalis TaxID=6523 RepID=A0AAV2GY00_LYMST
MFPSCKQWTVKLQSINYATIVIRGKNTAVDIGISSSQSEYEKALPFSTIPGPGGLPWFGQWFNYKLNEKMRRRRDLVIRELNQKFGDIVKETIAGKTMVHLFDLDFIKQIYETEPKYPIIPPLLECVQYYRKTKDLAPGLGNSNGEQWYKLRSVVQHIMLRPQKSLDYLPLQNKVANDFIKKFPSLISENGEIPDINRWIARWGIESAAHNCFDRRMGYIDDIGLAAGDIIIDNNSKVFTLSTKLFFALPFYRVIPTPALRQFFDAEDCINSSAKQLLEQVVKEYNKAHEEGKLIGDRFQFLSYMLNNQNISYKDVTAVVLSVLTDTLSTTTQALLSNLYTLASNPSAQEKAYEEAKKILQSGDLTVDGFNSSTYIKACIKETFRLFPTGLDILRLSPCNMVIGGYQVPEGTLLCLNNYISSLDPNIIPNPETFCPERWVREDLAGEKLHPYLLTPFSLGRRMCAGRRFAEQELVMMIAKILSQYRLEWHHEKLHQVFRVLQFPDGDVSVKFIPRSS